MNDNDLSHHEIISSFQHKNILVIGDFILDVYLKGISTRLSPEAPVPVVDVMERMPLLGGSANTVCNLRKLGAHVTYCTVIGMDNEGDEAIQLLEQIQVERNFILRTQDRKTISKTRVVAGNQVVTRFDYGTEEPLDEMNTETLIRFIKKAYLTCDAVVISDYDKGVVTPSLLRALVELQAEHKKFIAVDSKRLLFFESLRPSLAKPNYEEVLKLLNLPHLHSDRAEQIQSVSRQLYDKSNAGILAVTLDAEGSLVIEYGEAVYRCVAPPVSTPHVAGAGDTYLSAFVLGYVICRNIRISADIANAAASVAVKKEYTSYCSLSELKSYFHVQAKTVRTLEDLKEICEEYHAQGKRIVFTNGCFDILHSGHVTYLRCAKELGDVLIVGINTDDSIKRLKGETRPINPLTDRLQVLSGLSSVDYIVPFGTEGDDTPAELISIVRPHVFAKGGDYTKDKLPEAETVERFGGEIVFLPHIPDHSTTAIIKRLSTSPTSDQAIVSDLNHDFLA